MLHSFMFSTIIKDLINPSVEGHIDSAQEDHDNHQVFYV
jgi:hypothetical protein